MQHAPTSSPGGGSVFVLPYMHASLAEGGGSLLQSLMAALTLNTGLEAHFTQLELTDQHKASLGEGEARNMKFPECQILSSTTTNELPVFSSMPYRRV